MAVERDWVYQKLFTGFTSIARLKREIPFKQVRGSSEQTLKLYWEVRYQLAESKDGNKLSRYASKVKVQLDRLAAYCLKPKAKTK